jgi:hypothetical protein
VREAWREPSLEHIAALSDDVGIAQHATFDIPNRHEGYCTDDVARAFIVTSVACGFDRRREEARARLPFVSVTRAAARWAVP